MVPLVLCLLCLLLASDAVSETKDDGYIPKGAYDLAPVIIGQYKDAWPTMSKPSAFFSQIEKESCIHKKHPRCFNSRSEFKTDREYGFGLGMITITSKFNVFEEVKRLDSKLSSWKWEDRFNPEYQVRALIVKDKLAYRSAEKLGLATELDRLAVMFATYNGGSQVKDQILCRNTEGCDSRRWYPYKTPLGIKDVSWRSKTKVKGYGKSFMQINREYPDHILFFKRKKYELFITP